MIKKHFHENFVMSVEEERSFKSSNAGYLINFLLPEIKKVRDHDHVTRKQENLEVLLIEDVILILN